jgi:hypothetical protein
MQDTHSNLEAAMLDSLPPMPLIIQATVSVRDGATYEIFTSPDTMGQYSKWRYFTGDMEQYVEGATRVIPTGVYKTYFSLEILSPFYCQHSAK